MSAIGVIFRLSALGLYRAKTQPEIFVFDLGLPHFYDEL
jgi:hypothetical protein